MKYIIKLLTILLILFCVVNNANPEIALTYHEAKWSNPTKIRTYIPPNHKYTAKMKRACHEWSVLTKDGIVFKYVTDPNDAQIIVKFVNIIPTNMSSNAIGLTSSRGYWAEGKLTKCIVYIADYTNTKKVRKLTDDEVYTTMLHELGHAIGLRHTDNTDSIMYHNTRYVKRSEITNEELNILSEKYGWKKKR